MSICGSCHRARSCPDCQGDLRRPLICHTPLSLHRESECPGERRPAIVTLADYRPEDFITTGAPRPVSGARTQYHWEQYISLGWQERIPGRDFTVRTAAYRTAGANYARTHSLYFRWEMRGELFAFELSKQPFREKAS